MGSEISARADRKLGVCTQLGEYTHMVVSSILYTYYQLWCYCVIIRPKHYTPPDWCPETILPAGAGPALSLTPLGAGADLGSLTEKSRI